MTGSLLGLSIPQVQVPLSPNSNCYRHSARQQELAHERGPYHPHGRLQLNSGLLALVWLSSSCRHSRSEFEDGRCFPFKRIKKKVNKSTTQSQGNHIFKTGGFETKRNYVLGPLLWCSSKSEVTCDAGILHGYLLMSQLFHLWSSTLLKCLSPCYSHEGFGRSSWFWPGRTLATAATWGVNQCGCTLAL